MADESTGMASEIHYQEWVDGPAALALYGLGVEPNSSADEVIIAPGGFRRLRPSGVRPRGEDQGIMNGNPWTGTGNHEPFRE